ncbi:hypothetical protein PF003_g40723 [Phytophthora fragariae]|nr:hypothetical protein PF003_g40723 [Phytophthora fragariae]
MPLIDQMRWPPVAGERSTKLFDSEAGLEFRVKGTQRLSPWADAKCKDNCSLRVTLP